jgi:protease II
MRNEVMSMASKVRDNILATEEDENDYNADNERGKQLTDEMMKEIQKRINQDYPSLFHDELLADVAQAI